LKLAVLAFFLAAIRSPAQRFSMGLKGGAQALGRFSTVSGGESVDDRTARYTVGPSKSAFGQSWRSALRHCIGRTVNYGGGYIASWFARERGRSWQFAGPVKYQVAGAVFLAAAPALRYVRSSGNVSGIG
jgi:hypothetical protein